MSIELPFEELHDLDLIVFRGVYYHLKHPILAFERLAAAMKMGGTLHFEGEGLLNYAEDLDGKPVKIDFAALIKSNAPVCLIYPNSYKRASNWFVPTPAALRGVHAGGRPRDRGHEHLDQPRKPAWPAVVRLCRKGERDFRASGAPSLLECRSV